MALKLLKLATGCPMLREVHISTPSSETDWQITEATTADLCKKFPQLKGLGLKVSRRMENGV
jgi:hypothetical protein